MSPRVITSLAYLVTAIALSQLIKSDVLKSITPKESK